jgi:uncharacterized protein with PQ loop repeat
MDFMDKVALVAAIILPLFNIPLILKVIKRRSSEDLSVVWAIGVWICIILMAPSGLRSRDVVWRTFNFMNIALFSIVTFVTVKYRGRKKRR